MITTSTLPELKSHNKVDVHLIIKHESFFVKATADLFQEEERAVQLLISAVESLFISGLNYYHRTHTGTTEVFTMAKNFVRVKISPNMVENVENGYLLMKGGGALTEIFGNRLGQTLNCLVKKSGVRASTAYTYACLYTTVVLKSLGEQVTGSDMSAAAFMDYLETSELGLSQPEMAALLDENSGAMPSVVENTVYVQDEAGNQAGSSDFVKKVFSFVLLIVLVVSLYFLYKTRNFEPKTSLPGSVQQVKLIGISGS